MSRFLLFITACLFAVTAAAVDMPLKALDGSDDNLEHYQGRWVVVNYWATWCPPCIEEMPELQAFHNDHAEDTAVVFGINSELISQRQLAAFLDTYFISYPIYTAGPKPKSELGVVPGLPTTFLVSPQGEVVARQVGPVTREMLEGFIADWKAP